MLADPSVAVKGLKNLGDPFWHPLWDACQELGVGIHLHASAGLAGKLSLPQWKGYTRRQSHCVSTLRNFCTATQIRSLFDFFRHARTISPAQLGLCRNRFGLGELGAGSLRSRMGKAPPLDRGNSSLGRASCFGARSTSTSGSRRWASSCAIISASTTFCGNPTFRTSLPPIRIPGMPSSIRWRAFQPRIGKKFCFATPRGSIELI